MAKATDQFGLPVASSYIVFGGKQSSYSKIRFFQENYPLPLSGLVQQTTNTCTFLFPRK